jgi:hypothetical protein
MPPKVVHHNEEKYEDGASTVEYQEFPGPPHLPGGPGWPEVADFALEWAAALATDGATADAQRRG